MHDENKESNTHSTVNAIKKLDNMHAETDPPEHYHGLSQTDDNHSPTLSPFSSNKTNQRRSSALFESVNRSGAFSSSPEDICKENKDSVSKEHELLKNKIDQHSHEAELKPNQLDRVLKKCCPSDDEVRKADFFLSFITCFCSELLRI